MSTDPMSTLRRNGKDVATLLARQDLAWTVRNDELNGEHGSIELPVTAEHVAREYVESREARIHVSKESDGVHYHVSVTRRFWFACIDRSADALKACLPYMRASNDNARAA